MMPRYVPQLDDEQFREACRQTHPFWGRGRTLEEHTQRSFAQMREAGPGLLRRVGWVSESGELLCALKRYAVLLAVPGPDGPRQVRAVGIGSVFTAEPYRGRGAASALLRAVLTEAREAGDEAALLYSDIDPAFYARLGFHEFPALDVSAPVEALPAEGALATRPSTSQDEEQLRAWYDASFPAACLRPARDAALWRFFRWWNTARPEYILSDGGREVGYLHVTPRGRTLVVEEWAAPGIPAPRLWATVRQLARDAGADRVEGWLRQDQIDDRFTLSPRNWGIPMVADLTGTLNLSGIAPASTHFGSIDHF
jgi:GNAT superfamily N-acetyltransferase